MDLITSYMFGKSTSRIKNITTDIETIYIGVESSNEFYTYLENQTDSYFEVRTRLIPGSLRDTSQVFVMDRSKQEIEVVNDDNDFDTYYVRWNNIYETSTRQSDVDKYTKLEDVTYYMYAGKSEKARYSMLSMCAVQHASPN